MTCCFICRPDHASSDCQGCPDLPLEILSPRVRADLLAADQVASAVDPRTHTPVAAPSTDLLRFEQAVGRLRSLPTREQELRARAERAEAECERLRRIVGEEWDSVAAHRLLLDVDSLCAAAGAAAQQYWTWREEADQARAELAEERAHHERTLQASVDAIRELCEERGRWEAASHAIRAVCDALGLDRGGDHDLDAILDRIRDVRTERS